MVDRSPKIRVSVVVPVYNTGPYIEDLIASLRAQTLDPAEFEVLFVDDGSTDSTPALLDRVAAETPNFRVIHTPNSGWPGRPRNIGIDAAVGDYVFLTDHDDRLDPAALQRLTDFADEHGSDVVVGKIVGVGRSAPGRIFAATVVDAQRDPGLLMTSLTPQKLYRRAFLDARGIRFPEGKRRLEDHLFVTTAYLRAQRVSIYAEHPVYFFVLRDDGANASRRTVEWRGYFANAAESVAVVDAEAPDEDTRIVMRRRWLRSEALSRLRGPRFVGRTDDREVLIESVRGFVREHYPPAEIDLLNPVERVAARLLLEGRDADLLAFAAWEASLKVRPQVVRARIVPASQTLEVAIVAERRATEPLPAVLADPPAGYPTREEIDRIGDLPKATRITLRLRLVDGARTIEGTTEQSIGGAALTATARFDLASAPPMQEGRWRLVATVRGAGRAGTEPALVPREARQAIDTAPVRDGGRRAVLSIGGQRRLLLRIERVGPSASARRAAKQVRRLARDPRRVAGAVRRRAMRVAAAARRRLRPR